MGKFFNHYCPDRAVGFGHPYSDRRPETWHYTLGYRGYDLDVVRDVSLWQVGIHPRKPELPIIHRCEVRSHNQEEAVLEAKRRVDAILTLQEAPGLCIWRPHLVPIRSLVLLLSSEEALTDGPRFVCATPRPDSR